MKWEYMTHYLKGAIRESEINIFQSTLNQMGNEGWELINVISQIDSDFSSATLPNDNSIDCCESVYTNSNILIFKRLVKD